MRGTMINATITLSNRPDGYGFVYGTAVLSDGRSFNLNVMPPVAHWRGDVKLDGYAPDAKDWVFFVDGEEVFRTDSMDQARGAIGAVLAALPRPDPESDARITEADEFVPTLNAMAGSLTAAAALFAKDADLDRNDLLGEIDLGAARVAFEVAKGYAQQIVEFRGDHRAVYDGPGRALKRLAQLLAEDDGTIDEALVPRLGNLVDVALAIPQQARSGPEVDAFDKGLEAAKTRLDVVRSRER